MPCIRRNNYMSHRCPTPLRPDILHLAQGNLGTADQVTVFGGLFDAGIRSTHTMLPGDPRRMTILNEAMDRIYEELKREAPVQIQRAPVLGQGAVRAAGMKHPALKP